MSNLEEANNAHHALFNEHADMMNDMMIDVSIEIGTSKMKLSELLNLSEGTMIQLEQKSDDPLILYVNDKVIAKGHIISSNGKFSLRII